MVSGAQHSHAQPHAQQRLGRLLSGLLLLAIGGYAAAQTCGSVALLTQSDCQHTAHRSAPAAATGDKFPLPAAGVVATHQARLNVDPRSESEARGRVQAGAPMTEQFNLRWRNMPGPAWVGNVPAWVTDSAKNYRHRGLPLVDLWQSSHYMVALGLSNHGVPGVYFTQKLP